MIRFTVYKDAGNRYKGFKCEGHAQYSDAGSDIVCAAVSVLGQNTVNSIEKFTEDTVQCGSDDGLIIASFPKAPGRDAKLLMDSLVFGMEQIAENYNDFVDIEIEEV